MNQAQHPDNTQPRRPAVVLLSGGLDSATTLAIASRQGFTCHALTINYNQRHNAEINAAQRVAEHLNASSHHTIDLDLAAFGGSALTDHNIPVPKPTDTTHPNNTIPTTYVPARNLVFLSIAAAQAETLGATDIFTGVNAVDYSGYPDCRPQFIHALQDTINLATKAGIQGNNTTIHTPLINLTKADIIRHGHNLGIDYAITHSCYDPNRDGLACGRCESCNIRRKGFHDAHIEDPTTYA